MLQGSRGAVAVVGHRVDQDRHARRAVALVTELLQRFAGGGAGAAVDGALDLVGRHVDLARLLDRQPQPEVALRAAATLLRRDRHLAGDLGERDGSLGVDDRLLVLDAGPLRMARH